MSSSLSQAQVAWFSISTARISLFGIIRIIKWFIMEYYGITEQDKFASFYRIKSRHKEKYTLFYEIRENTDSFVFVDHLDSSY